MKTFQTISIGDAHALLAQPNTQLVDIRDEYSFDNGHIEHAQRIDNGNVGNFIVNADKSARSSSVVTTASAVKMSRSFLSSRVLTRFIA